MRDITGPTTSAMDAVTRRILQQRAIPVVRADTADTAVQICDLLIDANLDVIELTATIPDWADVLATVRTAHPDATVGMGTLRTVVDAELAIDRGAAFLVSPFPAPEVRQAATDRGVRFAEGGCTPGEIAAAAAHGLCKLYPAHLGGIAYLKTLRAILPDAQIMPTGGIRIGDVGEWLAAGAVAVGVGSDLYAAPDVAAAVAELRAQLDKVPTQ